MLFNSYIFVLLFLPVCLLGYYLLNHFQKYKLAQIFLIGMSLWFYGYFHVKYVAVIVTSVSINYLAYFFMLRISGQKLKRMVMLTAVFLDLAILCYFKYMDFFISTANHILKTDMKLLQVALPLGISFFTFQQISFVVDAYKDDIRGYTLLDYMEYVTFFPQLIAGPIVTHDELILQMQDKKRRRLNWESMAQGMYIFVLGMAKKVLVADPLGNVANIAFGNVEALNSTNAFIGMLAYTLQIYFDFSGYCDMAIGLGKMFHLELPLNFNSPYKALTITEFWERWHITLTRFFTRYVYIPLGGNRRGRIRTYINMLSVFLISGLWHGAGFSFILWGACHGLFCVITRHFKGWFDKLHPALSWLITFGFVNVTWVFFRADSIKQGLLMLQKMMAFDIGPIDAAMRAQLPISLPLALMGAVFCILACDNAYEKMKKMKYTVGKMLVIACLFAACVFSFTEVSTFLYFDF